MGHGQKISFKILTCKILSLILFPWDGVLVIVCCDVSIGIG